MMSVARAVAHHAFGRHCRIGRTRASCLHALCARSVSFKTRLRAAVNEVRPPLIRDVLRGAGQGRIRQHGADRGRRHEAVGLAAHRPRAAVRVVHDIAQLPARGDRRVADGQGPRLFGGGQGRWVRSLGMCRTASTQDPHVRRARGQGRLPAPPHALARPHRQRAHDQSPRARNPRAPGPARAPGASHRGPKGRRSGRDPGHEPAHRVFGTPAWSLGPSVGGWRLGALGGRKRRPRVWRAADDQGTPCCGQGLVWSTPAVHCGGDALSVARRQSWWTSIERHTDGATCGRQTASRPLLQLFWHTTSVMPSGLSHRSDWQERPSASEPQESAPSRRATGSLVESVPGMAGSGRKQPLLARVLTKIPAICMARRDGVYTWSHEARGLVMGDR